MIIGENMKKLIIILFCLLLISCGKKDNKSCTELNEGNFKIHFVSNAEIEIPDIEVNIGGIDEESILLSKPEKRNYEFGGWYYDRAFLTKVDGEYSSDVKKSYETDDLGCKTNYKDVTLYALWYEK